MDPCQKLCRETTALRVDLYALIALQNEAPTDVRRVQIDERVSIVCQLECELQARRRLHKNDAYQDFIRRLDDVHLVEIARSN